MAYKVFPQFKGDHPENEIKNLNNHVFSKYRFVDNKFTNR